MPRAEATTLPIHTVLGLSTTELDAALAWARGRAVELLEALDDTELQALLDDDSDAPVTRPPVMSPTVTSPTVTRPAITRPAITRPTVTSPTVTSPTVARPTVARPTVARPTVARPTVARPTPSLPSKSAARSSPPAAPTTRLRASPRVAAATRAVPQREPDAPVARTDGTRRRAQRHSLSTTIVVRIDSMPGLLELSTRDISLHGIFIESNAPPELHARISVQLPFPDGSGVVELEGEVVRAVTIRQAAASGRAPGFGVTFSPVSEESRHELERLLEHARASAAADVPQLRGSAATQAKTIQHGRTPSAKVSKG